MYLYLIPKAATKGKAKRLLCIPLKRFIKDAAKGIKHDDCWKIAVELLYTSASVPNEGGHPYLVDWALSGKKWKQYSLSTDARATSLIEASALLKRHGLFLSNSQPMVVESLFVHFKKQEVLASAWAKGLFTVVDGCKVAFDSVATNLNIEHLAGDKGEKRGTQTERNFLVAACLPADEVKIKVVKGKELKTAMDGTGTCTREFMLRLRNQWALANPQIKVDQSILDIKTLNFRGWIPGLKHLKVMMIVTDNKLPDGVDIVVHEDNFKHEVVVKGTVSFFGYDPQGSKPCSYTNKQCLRNFGWFFGLKTRVWEWFRSTLKAGTAHIKLGKTPEEEKYELQLLKVEKRIKDSFSTGERLRSITWNECKGTQAELPALFQGSCKDWFRRMASDDIEEQELWVEIPGSVFSQVVCLEAVKFVAPELYRKGIPNKKIVWLVSHKIFVVSTQYWEENLVNWGGCDQDDKFTVIFRIHKVTGRIVVLIYRTPNDRNEYAIAEADEGNLPSLRGEWRSEPCSYPTDRPLQASQQKDKPVELGKGAKKEDPRPRTFEDFVAKLGVAANPGWAVNIIACWNTGYPDRCPLPTMEQCIDLTTQLRIAAQIEELGQMCLAIVKKMHTDLLEKRITLDRKLALSVFGVASGYDEDFKKELKSSRDTVEFLTVESDYSQLCHAASVKVQKGLEWFDTVAEELSMDAWKLKLPKLQRIIARIQADMIERDDKKGIRSKEFYDIAVDRINKVFGQWASCYKGDDINLFRWMKDGEPTLSSMGFDLVLRKQKALLLKERKYLLKYFPANYSMQAFDNVLCWIALFQLFNQATPDHPKPIKDLEKYKGLEKGSLISHKWLFETFCRVRKQM
jgi:hypothetical protein